MGGAIHVRSVFEPLIFEQLICEPLIPSPLIPSPLIPSLAANLFARRSFTDTTLVPLPSTLAHARFAGRYLNGVTKGTTVGSAVYDRTVVPHVFLGVVGIDFTVDEMMSVAGSSYAEVLSALVGTSNANCPLLDKNVCMLQALREESGWKNR